MTGSYNKVLLMGNLTRDIEIRLLPNSSNGTADPARNSVANIGLAVNRRYAAANGVNREEVTFVDCEAWGKIAELMNQYLKKGSPIFIEGRLKLDQWEDKEGGKRSKLKVVVENFQFIGGNMTEHDGTDLPTRNAVAQLTRTGTEPEPMHDGSAPGYARDKSALFSAGKASPRYTPIRESDIPF